MDVHEFKSRLIEMEARLAGRTERGRDAARAQVQDSPRDVGDASVADLDGSQDFSEAERDASVLQQVRDALGRIDAGTFGLCEVDGEPIEAKRLEAVPWATYCLKHQAQMESASSQKTPTL